MTDQSLANNGYGKAFGPPMAAALTEILAWILLTFYKVDVPANIQIDFATLFATLLVVFVPHDIVSKLTNKTNGSNS